MMFCPIEFGYFILCCRLSVRFETYSNYLLLLSLYRIKETKAAAVKLSEVTSSLTCHGIFCPYQ